MLINDYTMKTIKYSLSLGLLLLLASCADETFVDFKTEKPESIAQYEYLNAYDALKTYIDRTAHPDFKLGAGITASEFLKGEMVRSVAVANFDEMVAGNAMKYASCVANDGTMDFATVTKFVEAAKVAGLGVYGHTLCWHSQQNNKYLNSLIKDKEIDVDPDAKVDIEDYVVDYSKDPYTFWQQIDKSLEGTASIGKNDAEGCLEIKTSVAATQNYFMQYFTADGLPTVKDKEYKLKMMIKGSSKGQLTVGVGPWSGRAEGGKFDFDTEWKEYEFAFKAVADGGHVMTQSGLFVGTIQIKYVKITHSEAPAVEVEQEKVMRTYQDGPFPFYVMGCEPPVIDGCIHFVPVTPAVWSQFFVLPGGENKLDEGNYVIYLDIKSSKDASDVELTMQNGWGGEDQKITVSVPVKEGSNVVKLNFSNVAGGNYDVILKPTTTDATLDVKSVKVCQIVKMNSIPLTPEEKAEKLTNELERWIKGMMEACGGYVKAWDVVNEPVSGGGDDGNGNYALQSATNPDDNGVGGQNFYWQDFLGNDFARIPIKFARKYFAEYGGNASDLKLFINDYNLESWWDDNKKVKSLIKWIERWESDGETKIDGIGTQMHVSYIMNEEDQKRQEASIVKMFELLAASGKLIKITELDMGIVEKAFGEGIKTELVTFEQHQKMSDFYKFIIQKYFEIIPVAQQYGITQWATTDSPADSGWRKGQPIGLWDLNYNRKPAYAGFTDGLAGK